MPVWPGGASLSPSWKLAPWRPLFPGTARLLLHLVLRSPPGAPGRHRPRVKIHPVRPHDAFRSAPPRAVFSLSCRGRRASHRLAYPYCAFRLRRDILARYCRTQRSWAEHRGHNQSRRRPSPPGGGPSTRWGRERWGGGSREDLSSRAPGRYGITCKGCGGIVLRVTASRRTRPFSCRDSSFPLRCVWGVGGSGRPAWDAKSNASSMNDTWLCPCGSPLPGGSHFS